MPSPVWGKVVMAAVNTLAPMAEINEVTIHSESGWALRKKTGILVITIFEGWKKGKKS